MPVEFTCDGCNRRLRAPDAKAGKRTTCPTCGKDLQIPVMGTSPQITLPTAGMPVHNPLDKLAISIPTASEAAAGFNLSKPAVPQSTGPEPVSARPQAEPIEIGLANDEPPAPASPASSSSSGIGNSGKSKAHAWRGGDKAPPPTPTAAGPAPGTTGSRAPASNPIALNIPAKSAPLANPSAGIPVAGASPLIPVASAAPSPLDDIFKDIPQVTPVNTPAPMSSGPAVFGGLRPVATSDPFAAQGAALPTASAPRWDQIASAANVGSSYSSSSKSSAGGFRQSSDIEAVRHIVIIPAILLLISYIFIVLGSAVGLGKATFELSLLFLSPDRRREGDGAGIAIELFVAIVVFVLAVAGLFGAIKMLKLRSRSAAMTAAIMAIVPFCACSPIGIWATVVLSMESVQRAFDANDRRHGS